MVRRNLLIRAPAPVAICALALAACGSHQRPPAPSRTTATSGAHGNHSAWIYSSLPLRGRERAQSLQIQEGIRLALGLAGDTVPGFHIVYKPLSDSPRPPVRTRRRGGPDVPSTSDRLTSGTASAGGSRGKVTGEGNWNEIVTADNAERAARNSQTVAYIGDLSSGATEVSLPILNQAGILQITPGSGYPGLTDSYKGVTQQNEPGKFYPQSPRNLLRLIPSDMVQAAAALTLLHSDGCQAFAAWQFGANNDETTALFAAVGKTASEYNMKVSPVPKLDPKNLLGYVHSLQPADIRCVVLVGRPTHQAAELTLELREQLSPAPTIVGTSGFCTQEWAQGISRAYREHVLPGLYCLTPERPIGSYVGARGARGFIARFRHAYHRRPTAFGYYGYEAARMVMRGLAHAPAGADDRRRVLDSLAEEIALAGSSTYAFTGSGDVLTNAYGVQSFQNGRLTPSRTVSPNYLLPSAG